MNDRTQQQPRRLLITAGPTHEPIDAVRYIANRSSGKLGIALADAAAERGLPVTLLLGPSHLLPTSTNMTLIRFRTAADLQELLAAQWPGHDVLIMAAAVADYRPAAGSASGKIRRGDQPLTLDLEPVPDLLAEIARQSRDDQTIIGFALEPGNDLPEAAVRKLQRKQIDAIVANPLETMDAETISGMLILKDGRQIDAPLQLSKSDFAVWLLQQLDAVIAAR